MTGRNRTVLGVWIRSTCLPVLLLAGGWIFANCSKDPVEPEPVPPESTLSLTFADGDFQAAFQTSPRGGYVAAGTGADRQGFIYKINTDGTESTHYVFDQNASAETVVDVLPANDGGYMVCGEAGLEGWVAKINGQLQTVENNLYHGSAREDNVNAMAERSDGGFLVGGEYDWDRTTSTGDGWLLQVNSNGVYESQFSFGGGATRMETPTSGASDAYILKVDASGEKLWAKNSGIDGADSYRSITPAHDRGYVCVGMRWDINSAWLVKIDDNGNIVWEKTFAGGSLYSVEQTSGNGYVCAGQKESKAWLLRVDINGDV